VFCSSTEQVREYSEKHVCGSCMSELSVLVNHLPA
jgi:hypothetical protein